MTKDENNSELSALQKIEFTGTAKEYFGIALVNLILSIVTLGIYSAWAKVRRETYFKNNTKMANYGFGYHATGRQILKGRLIIVGVLVALQLSSVFFPTVSILLYLAVVPAIPWLLNKAIQFSARMTSYRNIRFDWHGTYWGTLWYAMVAPLLTILTLGLLYPLVNKWCFSYFAKHYSFGTTRFTSDCAVKSFYFAYFKAYLLAIIFSFMVSVAFTVWMLVSLSIDIETSHLSILIVYLLVISFIIFYSVFVRNIFVKNLLLDEYATFDSRLGVLRYSWIILSNFVLIILSVGLLAPWAKIRRYRYLCASTLFTLTGDLETIVDKELQQQSSLGEAFSDIEGIDLSI